jgi:hypothetical protein
MRTFPRDGEASCISTEIPPPQETAQIHANEIKTPPRTDFRNICVKLVANLAVDPYLILSTDNNVDAVGTDYLCFRLPFNL